MDCVDRNWGTPRGDRKSFAGSSAELEGLHLRFNILEGKLYEDLKSHAEHVHGQLGEQHRSMMGLWVQVESLKQMQNAPVQQFFKEVQTEFQTLKDPKGSDAALRMSSEVCLETVLEVDELGALLDSPELSDAQGLVKQAPVQDLGLATKSMSLKHKDVSAGAAASCRSSTATSHSDSGALLPQEEVEEVIKALQEQHNHVLQELFRLEQFHSLLENRVAQQEEAHQELERQHLSAVAELRATLEGVGSGDGMALEVKELLADFTKKFETFRTQMGARIESVVVMGANQAAEFSRISAQVIKPMAVSFGKASLLRDSGAAANDMKDARATLETQQEEDLEVLEVWEHRLSHHHAMSFLESARATRQVLTPEQESDWDSCGWQSSIWDAAFFLGTPQLSSAGSVFMLLLLVVNVVIQVAYTYIVFANLTQPTFTVDIVDGFTLWRARMSESRFFDSTRNMSLADRVCSEDPSLEMSTQQANALADITEYRSAGPLMCVLAICIWVNACARELHRISRQWRSMLLVPRSKINGTRIVELETEAMNWRLESVSHSRLAFFISTLIGRLCICVWLLVNGVQFLVRTVSLGDLLMNAIALEFVLNIDELLFSSLAPFNTVRLLGAMERLPFQHKYHWNGVDLVSFLMALLTALVVLISIPVWLVPSIATLDSTLAALCGG